jgi:hypothetical protein
LAPTAFGLQISVVQALVSLQRELFGVPAQLPPPQMSLCVQAAPSLHATALFTCWQPVSRLHVSFVQGLLSLHRELFGVPWQEPAAHTSVCVQATPSLQAFVLFEWEHPVAALQVSFVHRLLSLQLEFTGVPTHVPPEQASVVHATASLQEFVLSFGYEHPLAVHTLSVQALPSLHRALSRT